MTWWIDEEPYPGPYEMDALTLDEFKKVFTDIATAYGMAVKQVMRNLEDAFLQAPQIAKQSSPPVRNHGPRSEWQFDRRGRRLF